MLISQKNIKKKNQKSILNRSREDRTHPICNYYVVSLLKFNVVSIIPFNIETLLKKVKCKTKRQTDDHVACRFAGILPLIEERIS